MLWAGGGTIAPIDDVRRITNVSSGRFSAAIAEACLGHGATVWHVHAPAAQLPLWREARFDLDTADPYAEHARLERLRRRWREIRDRLHLVPLPRGTVADYAGTLKRVLRTSAIDVAFLAMAVSDFEPEPASGKLDSAAEALVVRGLPTPKVIRSVRDWSPGVYLVGFKLLSGADPSELIRRAEEACRTNRAPDGGQRPADALCRPAHGPPGPPRPPARDPPPRRRPGRPTRRARLRLVRRPDPGRRRSLRTTKRGVVRPPNIIHLFMFFTIIMTA